MMFHLNIEISLQLRAPKLVINLNSEPLAEKPIAIE